MALIVVNQSFRPIFYWANSAEANYLLRQKQYAFQKDDISIAKILVKNKITNQIQTLKKTRKTDLTTKSAIEFCNNCLNKLPATNQYNSLMGIEGLAAKEYFAAYFQDLNWDSRKPRVKSDVLNATLDIGYTILFNYIECFMRMFGFDPYVSVYHRLWFKRKSLICDLIEPFRCIIDRAIRTAYNKKQISEKDFDIIKGEYKLKIKNNSDYCKIFYNALIPYKTECFKYIQQYYRCFMRSADINEYPEFSI